MTISSLDENTAYTINATCLISNVLQCIKELCQNALDASATSIELKLRDYGLTLLSVSDNGQGMSLYDLENVAKPSFTSKNDVAELTNKVHLYGYRGLSLHSMLLCSETLIIESKKDQDKIGFQVKLTHDKRVISQVAINRGTSVTIQKLFSKIPARLFMLKKSLGSGFIRNVLVRVLTEYALLFPNTRFILSHTRSETSQQPFRWTSFPIMPNQNTSVADVIGHLFGKDISHHLQFFQKSSSSLTCDALIFQPQTPLHLASRPDQNFIFVNYVPLANDLPIYRQIMSKLNALFFQNGNTEEKAKNRTIFCLIHWHFPIKIHQENLHIIAKNNTLDENSQMLNLIDEIILEFYRQDPRSPVLLTPPTMPTYSTVNNKSITVPSQGNVDDNQQQGINSSNSRKKPFQGISRPPKSPVSPNIRKLPILHVNLDDLSTKNLVNTNKFTHSQGETPNKDQVQQRQLRILDMLHSSNSSNNMRNPTTSSMNINTKNNKIENVREVGRFYRWKIIIKNGRDLYLKDSDEKFIPFLLTPNLNNHRIYFLANTGDL